MSPDVYKTELLADELKRIAGWGCSRPGAPLRLARTVVLSELVGVQSLPDHKAGCIIMGSLKDAILAYNEDREYNGRFYEAHILRRAWLLDLGYEQGDLNAPQRQERTRKLLKRNDSYDQWRKHHRLERGLLLILAEWMVSKHQN